MTLSLRTLLAAALLLSATSWAAADTIDNPDYLAWAKFKPGTTITLQGENVMGNMRTQLKTVTTLLEITGGKVVIESKTTMVSNGKKTDVAGGKTDIAAKIEKNDDAPATQPAKPATESLTVSGRTVQCKIVQSTYTDTDTTTISKTWTSDQVPGGLVKLEATIDGPTKGTSKLLLISMTIR